MTPRILHSADGEAIALHDLGGDGRPLLLTHGNGLNAGMWAAVAPLLRTRFRLFGLDFRGQGAAGPGRPGLSVERARFAEDVRAALAEIGDAPALSAGHSLGGVASIKAELTWPGTFEALWLYEPVLIPDDFERPAGAQERLVEASLRRRQEFDSVDDAYERFRSKPPFDGCRPEAVRAYTEIGTYPRPDGGVALSCTGETEARVFSTGEPQNFADYRAITCPTVIACGGTAPLGEPPAMVAPLVAAALGAGRLERFEHLTHFGPMEDPETIAASILSHLGPFAA
ncbi:MAG: alpha/beta fold hydrolase [Acidimicrobiales bacterium]